MPPIGVTTAASLVVGLEKLISLTILRQLYQERFVLNYTAYVKLLLLFKLRQISKNEKKKQSFPKGHTYSKLASVLGGGMYVCLKRLSFHSLIHFYKRCVSSLA